MSKLLQIKDDLAIIVRHFVVQNISIIRKGIICIKLFLFKALKL